MFPIRRPSRHGRKSAGPVRSVLGVQLLEDRTTPAGNVTLSVVNGDMILVGDGAAGGNVVTVTETAANRYTVAGVGGTTINGLALVDTLAVGTVNRDVKATFTGGLNKLNITGLGPTPTVLRDFLFNLSKGGDAIGVVGTFGRNVTINSPINSVGNDIVSITAGAGGTAGGFSGNVTISGQGGADTDTLTAAIAGNVSIQSKDGGEHATFNSSAIGGSVSVVDTAGSAGNDVSFVGNTQVAKNVTITNPGNFLSTVAMTGARIGGSVSITNGSTAGPASTVTLTSITINQSLSITGGDGSDSFTMAGGRVGKGVTVNLKAGTNTATVQNDSRIAGNVSVSAGNGDDTLLVATSNEIVGNVQVNLGSGKNAMTFDNSVVLGSIALTGGSAIDTIVLNELKTGKNLTINAGAGNNAVTLTSETFVGGNAAISNLAGVSSVTSSLATNTVLGNVSISYSSGGGTTNLSDFYAGGNVSIRNGSGGSITNLDHFQSVGSLTVTAGSGALNDGLSLDQANVYRNLVFSTGAGPSSFHIANDSRILGNLTVSHLDGGDLFDTHVGVNNVFGSVIINNGSGDSLTNLNGFLVSRNLTITNGAGIDQVVADDTGTLEYFGGNVTITNGAGNSTVRLMGKSSTERTIIVGNLSVTGGAGTDVVALNALEVGGTTNVSTGANNDNVLENDSTFTGNARFDLGADNDTLQLDTDALQARRSEFLAALTMNLGGGPAVDVLTIAGGVPATTVWVYGALNGDFRTAADLLAIGANAVHVGFPTF